MILESWVSPKAKKGLPSKISGRGLFATKPIAKDEVIAAKAGHIIDSQKLAEVSNMVRDSQLPITDSLYIAPVEATEIDDSMLYFNHSCEPNAGFGGNIVFVAMRDIRADEEITYDYAMDNAAPSFSFKCGCQTASCRKTITGDDWQNPSLQKKYAGYFSWFVEQKIKKFHNNSI